MRVMLLLAAAILTGCATAAQRELGAIRSGNQVITTEAKACLSAAYNRPEAAPIRSHSPFDIREVTIAQLADPTTPSPTEIGAILQLHPKLQTCRRVALDGYLKTTPTMVPILTKEFNADDDNIVLLLKKQITWGDYNKRRRNILAEGQIALQTEGQRVIAGFEQRHEAEMGRRQAAAQAFSDWAQRQQIINAINRPVTTTCMGLGSGIASCTSQ